MKGKDIILGVIHPFLVIGIWVIIWRNIDVYLVKLNHFSQIIVLGILYGLLFITDPQYFKETY